MGNDSQRLQPPSRHVLARGESSPRKKGLGGSQLLIVDKGLVAAALSRPLQATGKRYRTCVTPEVSLHSVGVS